MNVLVIDEYEIYLKGLLDYKKKKQLKIIFEELSLVRHRKSKSNFSSKKQLLIHLVRRFFNFASSSTVLKGHKFDFILLIGLPAAISYLVLARLCPFIKPKKKIIITYFFLHNLGSKRLIQRILHFILDDKKNTLILHSKSERQYFRESIGTRKAEVIVFPYCQDDAQTNDECGKGQNYIFAGGYSNRDYKCLMKAAKKIQYNFIIACSSLNEIIPMSSNVQVIRNIDIKDFNGYMKNSTILIVPLQHDEGSSGQAVALSGMSLKKSIIYSDAKCFSEYFMKNVSGLAYEIGNSDDLASKINYLLKNPDKRQRLSDEAFNYYSKFFRRSNFYNFLTNLLA